MAIRAPGLMSLSKSSRFMRTSSLVMVSRIVAVHVLSNRGFLVAGTSRSVELLDTVSGERGNSEDSLSRLVRLSCRRWEAAAWSFPGRRMDAISWRKTRVGTAARYRLVSTLS